MLKQTEALLTMMKQAAGYKLPKETSMVRLIKKGCLKQAYKRTINGKRIWTVIYLDHVRIVLEKLYKRDANKVALTERRF